MASDNFSDDQMKIVIQAAEQAEDIVSIYYKLSASQWLRNRYEIKTNRVLQKSECVDGPFAQIVKYGGQKKNSSLGSGGFDLYRVCLQDSAILDLLMTRPEIKLLPFLLYILIHELVHIVRFGQFEQFFHVNDRDREQEEKLVHSITREILIRRKLPGMDSVLTYYEDAVS